MTTKTAHAGDACRGRPYLPGDKNDLYRICLQTGDAGEDASQLFHDVEILGDLYVGPYLQYSDGLAWTIEDDQGIGGYLFGVADTKDYQCWFLQHWLPKIRKNRLFPKKPEDEWSMIKPFI